MKIKTKKIKEGRRHDTGHDEADVLNDERYKEIAGNPLFREIRRNERKVVVDKRFKGTFDIQHLDGMLHNIRGIMYVI